MRLTASRTALLALGLTTALVLSAGPAQATGGKVIIAQAAAACAMLNEVLFWTIVGGWLGGALYPGGGDAAGARGDGFSMEVEVEEGDCMAGTGSGWLRLDLDPGNAPVLVFLIVLQWQTALATTWFMWSGEEPSQGGLIVNGWGVAGLGTFVGDMTWVPM